MNFLSNVTPEPISKFIPSGFSLRTELSIRGLQLAAREHLVHERTDGRIPSIIFGEGPDGRHGNFHPLSYRNICSSVASANRLKKTHTSSKRVRYRSDWPWKELDCACSSDALLMNIFCFPDVMGASVRALLGAEATTTPQFGFKPRTPLHSGGGDNTEIDMKMGDLLVEAKLTESDFQMARPSLVTRYRDFDTIFEINDLPIRNGKYSGYQLIRGTLAAHSLDQAFCVFCDARRPDLIEEWFRIIRAVRPVDLRSRLRILTWQELASTLPSSLRVFLEVKYGIFGG